jgi:hypothetical protein
MSEPSIEGLARAIQDDVYRLDNDESIRAARAALTYLRDALDLDWMARSATENPAADRLRALLAELDTEAP